MDPPAILIESPQEYRSMKSQASEAAMPPAAGWREKVYEWRKFYAGQQVAVNGNADKWYVAEPTPVR